MACTNCGSNRIIEISGKHSDCFVGYVSHLNIDYDGYAPEIPGVCGGDYTGFDMCLDCGTVQNYTPMTDEEIKQAFKDVGFEVEGEEE